MEPKVYTSADHHIRNTLIDSHALTVLTKLHEAGHVAYLVGGGVRDLLMRKRPKDFDIATSALPEEVKQVFRNCLLIGRRFRLAHVRFGRKVIEVSTFRAGDPTDGELIVRDNVWGTPEEDVMRRDFTINGLFYDPLDHRIIDYVGGFPDLQAHLLRAIGEPEIRFKQDPVRMIRMLKFQARFGFDVEPAAAEALAACREEIVKSAPARVLEEMLRMLESGAAEPFFRYLETAGFLQILFPVFAKYVAKAETREPIFNYIKTIDQMNAAEHYRPLDRGIACAALLFPILEYEIHERFLNKDTLPHTGEVMELSHELIETILFGAFSHFPKKIRLKAHFVMHMQFRLTPLQKKRRPRTRMAKQKGFFDALVFLKLRSLLDPSLFKNYTYWKGIWNEARAEK